MGEKGFKRPIEVWLDNIKAMLEIKMGFTNDWTKELPQKCYPLDADWFIVHTSSSYMAFCTPSDPTDEFLMTENGYGIYEGPVSNVGNAETGEIVTSAYTEYHMFAHISPRLTIVLRSMLLPLATEDGNAEVRKFREQFLNFTKKFHHDPKTAVSFLEDLPVTKALNSYSKIVNGQYFPITGRAPVLSSKDSFRFRFFPLSFEHVSKINIIFLEEAYETSIIAFNNKRSMRRALEYYLSFEEEDTASNFKLTNGRDDCPRLIYLKKLEQAMKLLGGDVEAIYKTRNSDDRRARYAEDPVYNMVTESTKLLEIYRLMCKSDSHESHRSMLNVKSQENTSRSDRFSTSQDYARSSDQDRHLDEGSRRKLQRTGSQQAERLLLSTAHTQTMDLP